jgi:hypothetical protein
MQELKELSKLVTESRLKKIDFLYTGKAREPYLEVAEGIAANKIGSEEEISVIINASRRSSKFKMFKRRLREKLLANMFFLDLNDSNSTPYLRAIRTCGRNSYCINLLQMFSASTTAVNLAKSTLKFAISFELYETALFCARILRKQYSYRGDMESYLYYNALVEKYHDIVGAEDKIAGYLERMYVSQANINIFKPDAIAMASDYLTKVENILKKYYTYQNGIRYYRLKSMYEMMMHDYESALGTWIAFEQFLNNYQSYEYDSRLAESALQQLYCHLSTRNYEKGKECALKCEKLFGLHGNNWFIYKEYYFILSMHTRRYEEADATLKLVHSIPHFKMLNRNRQEKWIIFEAYNHIIQLAFAQAKGEPVRMKFKLSKFLNDIPTYNKDKEGFNTAVLIIQIMLLLLDRKYTSLPDKIEALKRYANRYFKKEAVYKSQTFMKMIIIADKCSYDKRATIAKTASLHQSLKTGIYAHVNTYDGIEIVPYADLWEIVLEQLD